MGERMIQLVHLRTGLSETGDLCPIPQDSAVLRFEFANDRRKLLDMKRITLLIASLLLGGCMTSHVMLGEPREPVSPDQVKIYSSAPAEFEEIAMIQSSSKASWAITEQGKLNTTIERMKQQAAKLGANGLLITGLGNGTAGGVHQGYSTNGTYGTGFTTNVQYKSGQAVAIWVRE